MNVLVVAQGYAPVLGGTEIHARQMSQELGKRHHVELAAGTFTPCRLPPRLGVLHTSLLAHSYPSYVDGEVAVHALTPNPLDRLRMLPIAARAMPVLSRYAYHHLHRHCYPWYRSVYLPRLRKLAAGADVIHSLAIDYLGWTAQHAAREAGIPFVVTPFVHPGEWGDGPPNVQFYRRADAVIALLDSDRRCLESLGVPPEKLHVVGVSPNLHPEADPAGFRDRHGLKGAPVVLFAGRMVAYKGAKALLQSAERVWESMPEARFVFIGPPGPDSADWFEEADPRILYLGEVTLEEKTNALAACDVFCMPSLTEILPTVYLEAWSFGKPVVGGKAAGLPELVEESGAGYTVSQEPEEIRSVLLRLLRDTGLRIRLGDQGRRLVESRYSVEAVARALEDLYHRLCGTAVGCAQRRQ